jgi:hypothetical protein
MNTEKINDCINTLLFNEGELKSQDAKDIIDVLYQCVKVSHYQTPFSKQSTRIHEEMANNCLRVAHMPDRNIESEYLRAIDDARNVENSINMNHLILQVMNLFTWYV